MRRSGLALLAAMTLFPATGAMALEAATTFRAEYRISYLGFKVASSRFVSTFSGDRYVVEGHVRSAGLARLFDRTTATTRNTGRLSGRSIEPQEYVLSYVHGGRNKRTAIRFRDGHVAGTENDPPLRPRGKDWVPLGAGDLAAALDPVSATIIRAASPREVCNRTLRVYDGEIRVDLPLAYAGTKPFSTEGFKGEAVRCKAGFQPVSGYRKGRRALEFMQRENRIEIAFAPTGANDVYAPVTATVETEIGPVRLYATRFGTGD